MICDATPACVFSISEPWQWDRKNTTSQTTLLYHQKSGYSFIIILLRLTPSFNLFYYIIGVSQTTHVVQDVNNSRVTKSKRNRTKRNQTKRNRNETKKNGTKLTKRNIRELKINYDY